MSRLIEYCAAFALLSTGALALRTMLVVPDLRPAANALNDSVARLHTSLTGAKKDGTDGLLYQAGAVMQATNVLTREAALTTKNARQVSDAEKTALTQYSVSVQAILDEVGNGARALTNTANQSTRTLGEATLTLQELREMTIPAINAQVGAVGPVLAAVTNTTQHIDQLVASKDVTDSIHNVADFTADTARFQHSLNLSLFGPAGDSAAGTLHDINGTLANVDRGTGYIADRLKPTKKAFWMALPQDGGLVLRALISAGVF